MRFCVCEEDEDDEYVFWDSDRPEDGLDQEMKEKSTGKTLESSRGQTNSLSAFNLSA